MLKDRFLIGLVVVFIFICIIVVAGFAVYPLGSGHSVNNYTGHAPGTIVRVPMSSGNLMGMNNSTPSGMGMAPMPGYNGSMNGSGNNTYHLAMNTLPASDGPVMVYTTVNRIITKDYVRSLGGVFGFSPDVEPVLNNTGDIFGAMCPNGSYAMQAPGDKGRELYSKDLCVYFPSGAIMYVNNDFFNANQTGLDSATARKKADDFLNKNGLMPQDAVFDRAAAGDASLINAKTMNVTYKRMINGLPVIAWGYPPGNQLEVDMSNSGEVVEFYETWREVQPYQNVPVKTPQQAFNDLENGKDVLSETYLWESLCGRTGYGSVNVTGISLGYWTLPPYQEQEYLTPVYILQGDISGKDFKGNNTTMPYTAYESAAIDNII